MIISIMSRGVDVRITEYELRSILEEIDKAKDNIEFDDSEISNSDMAREDWLKERAKRGYITVKGFGSMEVIVDLENRKNEEKCSRKKIEAIY